MRRSTPTGSERSKSGNLDVDDRYLGVNWCWFKFRVGWKVKKRMINTPSVPSLTNNKRTCWPNLCPKPRNPIRFRLAMSAFSKIKSVVHDSSSFNIGVHPRGNEKDRKRSTKDWSQEKKNAGQDPTSQEITLGYLESPIPKAC